MIIKEHEGTRLSEATLARKLLRRSGLKHDEKRHVLASCGHEYNHDKIRTALRLTNAMRTATTPGVASLRRPRLHRLLTRSRPSGGSRSAASTTSTHFPKKIIKTIMNKLTKINLKKITVTARMMNNKMMMNSLTKKMKKVQTSTRTTSSSGRSSTKVSKLARSSRAHRRVGRSQLVEDEVDTDDLPSQVHRSSRRSRRRRPESASTVPIRPLEKRS